MQAAERRLRNVDRRPALDAFGVDDQAGFAHLVLRGIGIAVGLGAAQPRRARVAQAKALRIGAARHEPVAGAKSRDVFRRAKPVMAAFRLAGAMDQELAAVGAHQGCVRALKLAEDPARFAIEVAFGDHARAPLTSIVSSSFSERSTSGSSRRSSMWRSA